MMDWGRSGSHCSVVMFARATTAKETSATGGSRSSSGCGERGVMVRDYSWLGVMNPAGGEETPTAGGGSGCDCDGSCVATAEHFERLYIVVFCVNCWKLGRMF